jgi:hypothetical protein
VSCRRRRGAKMLFGVIVAVIVVALLLTLVARDCTR